MTARSTLRLATLLALCLFLAAPAQADEFASWMTGVSAGRVEFVDYSAGAGTMLTLDDTEDTGYMLFGGYQFFRHFALVEAYVDLGEINVAGTIPAEAFTDTISADGFNTMGMGILPVASRHSFFGYVGLFRWEQDVNYQGSLSGPFVVSEDGWSPSFGIGYNWYTAKKKLGLHVEYSRFQDVGDANISGHENDRDFFSAGLVYSFR